MANLENLLERVKAAPGREIALEREIMCAIGGWQRLSPSQHPRNHKHPMFVDTQEGYGTFEGRALYRDVPRIMESVDAALALVERVRPFKPWFDIKGVNRRPDLDPLWVVVLDGAWEGKAPTLPLAILSALLSALIAQEPTHD